MRSSDSTSATRRYLPQRKPGARKPRFLRLAARQADGPRGMRAACGTSLGSGTCVVDTNKTRKGVGTIRPEGGRRGRSRSDVCRRGSLLRGETIDRRARTGRIGGPKIPAGIMELGNSVWEDEGTLHWKLRIGKDVEVPGGRRFRQRPLTSSTTTRSGRGHSGGSRVYHSNASCRMLPRTT